ncbi:hypothetical protein ACKWTF_009032 [Chironomus riparius]
MCLAFLSFLGFTFFLTSTILVFVYYDSLKEFLHSHYGAKIDHMIGFIILSGFHAFAFGLITIQLVVVKPKTTKVIIPLVIVVSTAFFLLVAIDFFIEVHLLHVTPKEQLTKTHDDKAEMPEDDQTKKLKKKGKGFKLGYLVIYSSMCVVVWFLYLAFKDLEEDLERQKSENEPMEITISHIT